MTTQTGNRVVDEFLTDYDRRISDNQTPESSKAFLRKMRPAVWLLAVNEPDKCEAFFRKWFADNL